MIPANEQARMIGVLNGYANAALTMLEEPGGIDAYGDASDGYVQRWTGAAPAMLEAVDTAVTMHATDGSEIRLQLADTQSTDTLIILDGVAPIVAQAGPDWQTWRVTVEDQRTTPSVTRTFQILGLTHDAYDLLDSVTLQLDHRGAAGA